MNNRRTRLRSAFAVALTVLVLVPTGILFARVWQDTSDMRTQAELEQKGVQYLTVFSPLVSAVAEYQSSALQGIAEAPASLRAAMIGVSDADSRLGGTLRTRERWAGIQAEIGKLAGIDRSDPLAVYRAHKRVGDLVLALYGTVQRNAHLNRDPDNDMANLQEAVTNDLPVTVTQAGRLDALATLTQKAAAANRPTVLAEFNYQLLALQASVTTLTDNLQAAVDDTRSATLSGNMVSPVDAFRRGIESMIRGANAGGTPNPATMSTAQSTLQTALDSLSGTTLKEMAELLDTRLDDLSYRRNEAIVLAAVALALGIGAILVPTLGARRSDDSEPMAPTAGTTGERDRTPAQRSVPDRAAVPGDAPPGRDPVPAGSTWREQSGALR